MEKTLSAQSLKGILPKREKPVSIEEMNAAIAEGGLHRYKRFLAQHEDEEANRAAQIGIRDTAVKSK